MPDSAEPSRAEARPPVTVTLSIPSQPTAASVARGAMGALATSVEPELLEDLRLLVTELVGNSVRHSGLDETWPIGLEVVVSDERITVEVSDSGPGFKPGPAPPDAERDSGWGLHLVDRLSSRWLVVGYGGNRVRFEIDRTAPGD